MNRRVLRSFLLFVFTLLLSIGVLWRPLYHLHHEKERLKEFETLYQSLKEKEQIKKDHAAAHQHLTELQQKDFLIPFDEKECLDLLTNLAKQSKVSLKQFHFGEPFEDSIQRNQPLPLFVSYTPITISLQASSEPALRQMIETFHQKAKGIIFPRHLVITHTKNHEFLVTYEFFGVRGKS